MATSPARALVEQLIRGQAPAAMLTAAGAAGLEEGQGGDMRFDLNCRVEIWITADDIADDRRARQIANGAQGNTEEKIVVLKNLAQTIAAEKINGIGNGIELTCDSLALSSVNVDRIDWHALALSDAEKRAAEEAEEAAFERRFPG